MTTSCPTCGQPMPDQPRRDPPLAPLEHPNVVTALVAMERAFGRDEGYHYTREQIAAVGLARRALCQHFDVKPATEPCAKVPRQTHG